MTDDLDANKGIVRRLLEAGLGRGARPARGARRHRDPGDRLVRETVERADGQLEMLGLRVLELRV